MEEKGFFLFLPKGLASSSSHLLEEEEEPGCDSELDSGSGSESGSPEIEEAVRTLLQGLGEDPDRDGLRRTPHRVAKAFRDGTRGYGQKAKDIVQGALFMEVGLDSGKGYAGGAGGLVVIRDLSLFSYCESCLLPFRIVCHVGYVPSKQRVVGLSKVSRVADVFAKRLQEPQRLANEVCSALYNNINPAGVAVVLQCWHIPHPEALISNPNTRSSRLDVLGWTQSSVCSSLGVLEDNDNSLWLEFSSLLKLRGIDVERGNVVSSPCQSWCPSRSLAVPLANGYNTMNPDDRTCKLGAARAAMVAAVASIIHSFGDDPSRKELVWSPYRYVHWLMIFKTSNIVLNLKDLNLDRIRLQRAPNGNSGSQQNEICSTLNIPFFSQCEHHLLPFHGVVHICYFGEREDKDTDRSSLQSIVHFYACKLQVQERLTRQIAEAVYSFHNCGVMVVVEANHICMVSRGIEKIGSSTATIAVLGQFASSPAAKAMFLETIANSTWHLKSCPFMPENNIVVAAAASTFLSQDFLGKEKTVREALCKLWSPSARGAAEGKRSAYGHQECRNDPFLERLNTFVLQVSKVSPVFVNAFVILRTNLRPKNL